MSDKTVDDVMALAYDYAQCADWSLPPEGEREAQKILQAAIAALVEQRDQAVKERDQAKEMLNREVIIRDGWLQDAIKERDQSVKYKRQMAERVELYSDELRAIRHTIVSTIGGVDEEGFPTSELNWLQRLRQLLRAENQRDILRARVVELEKAVLATFGKQIKDGWWQCVHCLQSRNNTLPYNPEPFPHAPGCIVRTIPARE